MDFEVPSIYLRRARFIKLFAVLFLYVSVSTREDQSWHSYLTMLSFHLLLKRIEDILVYDSF